MIKKINSLLKNNNSILITILIVLALLNILRIFIQHPYELNIKGLTPILKPISINLELNTKTNSDNLMICFDDS
ncbi:hypothetical protein IJ670_03690, partial [bacterium]|nr:hypothetical protein [bacterium]